MRNRLAVAIATIEGCRDGILSADDAHLGTVLDALYELDVLINDAPAATGATSSSAGFG